jgi:hypothetical protein
MEESFNTCPLGDTVCSLPNVSTKIRNSVYGMYSLKGLSGQIRMADKYVWIVKPHRQRHGFKLLDSFSNFYYELEFLMPRIFSLTI